VEIAIIALLVDVDWDGGRRKVQLQKKSCSSLLLLFYECMHDVGEEESNGRGRGVRVAEIFIFEEKTKTFRIFS
jgi:hypothetical protein